MRSLAVNENPERREKVLAMESVIRNEEQDLLEGNLTHHFAPNLYARELLIPAGHVLVGKIHKHAHLNNISQGSIAVYSEHNEAEVYNAPHQWVSVPGTKRVLVALTDTIWTTYHPTKETDLEKIEEAVIAKSFEEIEQMKLPDGTLKIESQL